MATATTERAVLAGGCFWGTQDLIHLLDTGNGKRRIAEETIADVDASGLWPGEAVTEVSAAGPFWEAEPEHHDYVERCPNGYSCHYVRPQWRLPRRQNSAGAGTRRLATRLAA